MCAPSSDESSALFSSDARCVLEDFFGFEMDVGNGFLSFGFWRLLVVCLLSVPALSLSLFKSVGRFRRADCSFEDRGDLDVSFEVLANLLFGFAEVFLLLSTTFVFFALGDCEARSSPVAIVKIRLKAIQSRDLLFLLLIFFATAIVRTNFECDFSVSFPFDRKFPKGKKILAEEKPTFRFCKPRVICDHRLTISEYS